MKKGETVKQHLADTLHTGSVEQFFGNPHCETPCTTRSALEAGVHETFLVPYENGIK